MSQFSRDIFESEIRNIKNQEIRKIWNDPLSFKCKKDASKFEERNYVLIAVQIDSENGIFLFVSQETPKKSSEIHEKPMNIFAKMGEN